MSWPLPWLLTSEHLVPSLVHTLWQGVLVAVALSVALTLLPAQRAQLRYVLSLAALGAMVAGWLITWNVLEQMGSRSLPTNQQEARVAVGSPPAQTVVRIETDGHSALDPDATARRLPNSSGAPGVPFGWANWRRALAAGWLLGVGMLSLRLIVSLVGAYREAGRALASPGITHELTRELCDRLRVTRSVRVAAVERLRLPAVIGVVWPTILLPVTLLGETSSEQLRFILAHELAHIRRHDYLINLAQMAVETLLFFNPAVWWISRRARVEREACCDALAVAALGNAAGYARTLVDWATREAALTTVAVGFAPSRVSQLRERVSRLLLGSYRPRLGVAPWSLLGLCLAGGLALAGLSSGTGLAVAVAAEIMSPAERIEKIAQTEQQYAEPPLEEGKLQISGTVNNADGGPISKAIQLQNYVRRKTPNSSSFTQRSMSFKGGKFTDTVNSGELWVWGQQPGYALSIIGPIAARASAPPGPLELVFNRGFSAQLLVTDARGKPVPGAKVDASQHVKAGGFNLPVGKLTTDAFGQATLEQLDQLDVAPLKVNVVAPGFQEIKTQTIDVAADRVTSLQLKPAALAAGLVTFEATGKPAAGARLVTLQVNRRRAGHTEGFQESKLLATTDDQGRFALDTLGDDFSYDLVVEGKDGSRALLNEVRAGDTKLQVKLPKPIVVRGTVLHPEKLRDGKLRYTLMRTQSRETSLVIRDGVGHFEITGVIPPDLTIWTPYGWGVPIDLSGPLDNVVIDLSRTSPPIDFRPVSVRLLPPEGMPAAQGTLHVGSLSEGVPIKDGTATFQLLAGPVSLSPRGLAGYWFPSENLTVTGGLETLVHKIRVFPAGAVTGKAEWVDPNEPEPRFQLFDLANSRQAGDAPRYQPEARARAQGREFLISPMPLETGYGLLVIQGATTGIGLRMELESDKPLLEVSVPAPEKLVDETGVVTDENGQPLAGAIVRLEVGVVYQGASHVVSTSLTSTMTDPEGKFTFSRLTIDPRVSYTLVTEKSRYQPYYDMAHHPSGEPLGIQLRAGHRLQLRLFDAEGKPARQVHVRMRPEGDTNFENTRYVWTDAQGTLDIDTLPAGEIEVSVQNHSVHLQSDGLAPIDLRIEANGDLQPVESR